MLSLQGLKASYGAAQILDDVSFMVRRGEVVALIGRNGAGKSHDLQGDHRPDRAQQGSVRFLGRDIGAEPPTGSRVRGLGYVPEDRRIFTDLTVEENLEVGRQPPRRPTAALDAWTQDLSRCSPISPRCAAAPGRRDERRRAADADDRRAR